MCVGLCLISCDRIDNIKVEGAVKKNTPTHIWKIADPFCEGDVLGNICDVNDAALIIHAWKRTNLSEAVFPGISLNITATLTF